MAPSLWTRLYTYVCERQYGRRYRPIYSGPDWGVIPSYGTHAVPRNNDSSENITNIATTAAPAIENV